MSQLKALRSASSATPWLSIALVTLFALAGRAAAEVCCFDNGHCYSGLSAEACAFFGGTPTDDTGGGNSDDGGAAGTGACCFGPALCLDVSADGCTAFGGFFVGVGTACADTDCSGLAGGACCQGDGGCRVIAASACAAVGGTYLGDGVPCSGASCAALTGACCLSDEQCLDGMSAAGCVGQGGTFHGVGSACAGVQCVAAPSGACCLADACVILPDVECVLQGGIFWQDVPCSAVTCPYQFGACCLLGNICIASVTQGHCESSLEGTWAGSLSTCPCAPAVCAGDVNCDGLVGFLDIDAFIARFGCPGYADCVQGSGCPWQTADITGDGVVDFTDIEPFIGRLGTFCDD